MGETSFERHFIQRLKTLPNSYWLDKGDPGAILGLPDRVGCVAATFCSLEFKANEQEMYRKTKRKKLQQYNITRVRAAGGYAKYVYPENADEVFAEIEEIAYGKQTNRNNVLRGRETGNSQTP